MEGRQLRKFPSDIYFKWVSVYQKISSNEIIKGSLKKENTSKKNNNADTETKIKTWLILISFLPYSFTIEKSLYSSFLVPWKFVESTCFFTTMQSHWGFISSRRLILTFGNLTSLDTKIFVIANSKCKKYENFIENIENRERYRKLKIRL